MGQDPEPAEGWRSWPRERCCFPGAQSSAGQGTAEHMADVAAAEPAAVVQNEPGRDVGGRPRQIKSFAAGSGSTR